MIPYRVLVVDDSIFMRKIISDLLSGNPRLKVVDTAVNGAEAVEKVKQLKPDVVTMDVEMPVMDGLRALQKIMAEHPTPVVMLSSLTQEGADQYRTRLSAEGTRSGHRPSVDVLFESLLPFKELKRHAVLMTGMGSDGAAGMLALKQAGAVTTIAEAEETCVVYGMPRAAVERGAAIHILPQQHISGKLVQLIET
ncbi:chemotaxis protein CheB [Paenibacillus sp. SAFN-117]|uniref:chemotaxis protein CheB n=1 Tax=Paenibacillus sp. SAFN-117 TaxID=3436860 RepID=UPI003F7D18BA